MATPGFDDRGLLDDLEQMDLADTDALDFGLIVLDAENRVLWYNQAEAAFTGFDRSRVTGRKFFETVGPCMNNFMVAERFVSETTLDETLDYVFTLKMAPTAVRLRLLKARDSDRQYLAVQTP